MLDHDLEPIDPYPGARTTWRCRCRRCGDEVHTQYGNVRSGWRGCRRCARQARADHRRGDAALAEADLRAAGLDPLVPYTSVMTPWLSQCRVCGHVVSPTLNNLRRGQGGCGWCAGTRVDAAEAVVVMRAAGLEPLEDYPGRHRPWPCRCSGCEQVVIPRYGAIAQGGGCRYCNDPKVDGATAAAVMRMAGLEPLISYPGSIARWPCRCRRCEREVTPQYATVARGWGGCRWCAETGFRAAEDAVVYLLRHDGLGAAKVGISNRSDVRLGRFVALGWDVLLRLEVRGVVAQAVESEIKDWWRDELGLPIFLTAAQMGPYGGYTETVDITVIDLAATMERMHRATAEGRAA